jgi:hypothetical protein
LIEQRRNELSLVLVDSALDAPGLAAFQSQIKGVNPRIRVTHIGGLSKETDMTVLDKPFSALDLLKFVQRSLRS